jgi:iron complex outermembrane receptor protein
LLEVDDLPSFRAAFAAAGPLTDRLLGSLSVEGVQSEGYLENKVNAIESANDGRDIRSRASLRWLPGNELELYLTADYAEFNGLWGIPGVPRGCNCYETFNEHLQDAEDTNYGGAFHVDWDLGFAALTAISGYRRLSSQLPFDQDGGSDRTPNFHDFETAQRFLSQEVRLASIAPKSRLRWLAGLFYFDEMIDSRRRYSLLDQDTFPSGIVIDAQDTVIDRDGWAAFGQLDVDVLDRLTLGLGARFSSENANGSLDLDFAIYELLGPGDDFVLQAAESEAASFSSTTWTVSLSYRVGSDTTVYLTASEGFRAGGFPLSAADLSSFTPFDNEESVTYEAGLKGRFADGLLSFDFAAFQIELEDQQLAAVIQVLLPGATEPVPVATITNAGRSSVYGGELSIDWQATGALGMSAAVGYTSTEFDDYVDADGVQHAGEPFRFVPEWTGHVEAEYRVPIARGKYEVALSGGYRYVDTYRQGYGVLFDPEFTIDAYEIVDLSASLTAERWSLQLFVDNAMDDFIETRAWNAFFFLPDGTRAFSAVYPPRTIGLRMTFDL